MSRQGVTIAVVARTGKTSLISSVVAESFSERVNGALQHTATKVPPVLQPVIVPAELTPEKIALTIIDTSSDPAHSAEVAHQLRHADVVVIVCAHEEKSSIHRVQSFWLPLLDEMRLRVPVLVAVNKSPLTSASTSTPASTASQAAALAHLPLLSRLVETMRIEQAIPCSAKHLWRVADVFFAAQRAVLAPLSPLFEPATGQLRPAAIKALRRLFRLFDSDEDSLLSEAELTRYQACCHGRALSSGAMSAVQLLLSKQSQPDLYRALPSSSSSASASASSSASSAAAPASPLSPPDTVGVTFSGFCVLHVLMLHSSKRADVVWAVLTAFGYDPRSLHLSDAYVAAHLPSLPKGGGAELTAVGVDFLARVFRRFDEDGDGLLSFTRLATAPLTPSNVDEAFAAAPDAPFAPTAVRFVSSSAGGALDLSGWLSLWALLALTHPLDAARYMLYLSYPVAPYTFSTLPPLQAAIRVQPSVAQERKANVFTRRTLTCLVLGAAGVGKSALCSAFIGRAFGSDAGSVASTPRAGLAAPPLSSRELSPLPGPAVPSSVPGNQPVKGSLSPATSSPSMASPPSAPLSPAPPVPLPPFSLSTAQAVCNVLPTMAPKVSTSRRASTVAVSPPMSPSQARSPPSDQFLRLVEVGERHSVTALAAEQQQPTCDVAVIVYDATRADSFLFAQQLMDKVPPLLPSLLVATKADLASAADVELQQQQLTHRCRIQPFSAKLCTGASLFDLSTSPPTPSAWSFCAPAPSPLFSLIAHAAHTPAEYRLVTWASVQRARQVQVWVTALVAAGLSIGAVLAYLRLSLQRGGGKRMPT